MDTVKLEEGTFVWEEVEGKGRCLVPYVESLKVTAKDVEHHRRYFNKTGAIQRFISAYGLDSQKFYTVLSEGGWCYSGKISRSDPGDLARYVVSVPPSFNTAFGRWAEEGE